VQLQQITYLGEVQHSAEVLSPPPQSTPSPEWSSSVTPRRVISPFTGETVSGFREITHRPDDDESPRNRDRFDHGGFSKEGDFHGLRNRAMHISSRTIGQATERCQRQPTAARVIRELRSASAQFRENAEKSGVLRPHVTRARRGNQSRLYAPTTSAVGIGTAPGYFRAGACEAGEGGDGGKSARHSNDPRAVDTF